MGALSRTLALFLLLATVATGCSPNGTVVQGRTVAFDPDKKTVTIIRDTSRDPAHPRFDGLPPETFRLPADPQEMGPAPRPGRRLRIDPDTSRMTLYNPATQTCDTITLTIVARHDGVNPADPRVRGKRLPTVDRATHVVTLYCPVHKVLLEFLPPEAYVGLRPEEWSAGDVVRIFFKTSGFALRLMNVSQTNLFEK